MAREKSKATANGSKTTGSTGRVQKDGRKTLNPQAADYYKRLILVSERYIILVKRHRRTKVALWFTIMGWITTILIVARPLLTGVTELVKQVMESGSGPLGL